MPNYNYGKIILLLYCNFHCYQSLIILQKKWYFMSQTKHISVSYRHWLLHCSVYTRSKYLFLILPYQLRPHIDCLPTYEINHCGYLKRIVYYIIYIITFDYCNYLNLSPLSPIKFRKQIIKLVSYHSGDKHRIWHSPLFALIFYTKLLLDKDL